MSISQTPNYSNIFSTLYDEKSPSLSSCYHYSVLRSFEYRDVCNNPVDAPLVHDFAIIWDDDHDERIIKVAERIYLAGLLSPIQFMGEHKGTLTIILAAKAKWSLSDTYLSSLAKAAFRLGDDYWTINTGYFDRHDRDFQTKHQTDLNELLGIDPRKEHTHILSIDDRWNIGTKFFDEYGILKMHLSNS